MPPDQRQTSGDRKNLAYLNHRFHLELDGHDVGVVSSIDGGHFKSDAIAEQVGNDNLVTRYPGRQKFEDITIQIGSSLAPDFWKWLQDSIDQKPSRRNGAIVTRDFDGNERSRREFSGALLSELQFPALDARGKSPAQLTIKFAVEQMTYKTSSGKGQGAPDLSKQKAFLLSSFSFNVDGIDDSDSKYISKLEAFTIKQNIINNPMGGFLYVSKEPGRLEFPNLTITTAERYAGSFHSWWEDFVGKGNHVGKNERSGSIVYKDSRYSTLLTIKLEGIGVTGITFDKHESQTDSVRNCRVDMYVERMSLTKPAGGANASQ